MLYTLREVTISTFIFQRRKMKLISLRGLSNVALIPTQVTSYSQVYNLEKFIWNKQTKKKQVGIRYSWITVGLDTYVFKRFPGDSDLSEVGLIYTSTILGRCCFLNWVAYLKVLEGIPW